MAATARTMPTIFAGGRLRLAVPNSSAILIPGPGPRSMPGWASGSELASAVRFGSGLDAPAGGRVFASSGMVASLRSILYRLPADRLIGRTGWGGKNEHSEVPPAFCLHGDAGVLRDHDFSGTREFGETHGRSSCRAPDRRTQRARNNQ